MIVMIPTGRVRVTRQGGGLGESVIGATIRPPALGSGSDRRAWPGKREQVWPSGPMPSSSMSSRRSGPSASSSLF